MHLKLHIYSFQKVEKFTTESAKSGENKENNVELRLSKDEAVKKTCQKVSFAFFKNNEKIGVINQDADNDDFGSIHLNLPPGAYQVVAIGHNGTGNCTISSPEKVTFASNKLTDTFSYYGTLDVEEKDNTSETITLQRAVAMFRLVIKDKIPENAKKIKFYYTGGSSTLNVMTGFGCVNSKQTEILDITPQKQVYEVYTFPHSEEKKLQVIISILDENEFTIASTTFSDVKVAKNYITTYSGNLFDNTSGGTVDIKIDFDFNPNWAGETIHNF